MLPRWKLLAVIRQQKIFDKLNNHLGDAVGDLLSLRRRPARSCSQQARFWLLGRNAAERAKNPRRGLPGIGIGTRADNPSACP